MKTRVLFPLMVLAALVLLVGLACGTSTPVPTAIPPSATQIPTNVPTRVILPTQPSLPPTATLPPDFFTENFLGDLSQWTYYATLGDESKLTQTQTNNGLRVELDDPNLYVYFYYDPYTYQDVRLDLTFTNLAHNSNNVNLVCRSSDNGRYEFTVQNDGLYQIWAYDGTGGSGYVMLASGASTAIHSGQQENEIAATCSGNTLTLYINGHQVNSVTDNQFFYSEGQVGFGVNISPSNPVTPVTVEFTSLTISLP